VLAAAREGSRFAERPPRKLFDGVKLMDSSVPSSLGGCLPPLSASRRFASCSSLRLLAWPSTIVTITSQHQPSWNGGWRMTIVLRCGMRVPHSKATASGIRSHMWRIDGFELSMTMSVYCLAPAGRPCCRCLFGSS